MIRRRHMNPLIHVLTSLLSYLRACLLTYVLTYILARLLAYLLICWFISYLLNYLRTYYFLLHIHITSFSQTHICMYSFFTRKHQLASNWKYFGASIGASHGSRGMGGHPVFCLRSWILGRPAARLGVLGAWDLAGLLAAGFSQRCSGSAFRRNHKQDAEQSGP